MIFFLYMYLPLLSDSKAWIKKIFNNWMGKWNYAYMSDPQDLKQIQTWTLFLALSWLEERYWPQCLLKLLSLIGMSKCLVREICCFVTRWLHLFIRKPRRTLLCDLLWLTPFNIIIILTWTVNRRCIVSKIHLFCPLWPWLHWVFEIWLLSLTLGCVTNSFKRGWVKISWWHLFME